MPRERLSMRKIKEVLRLKQTGLSNRAIAEKREQLNLKIMDHLGKSRWDLFDTLDRPALRINACRSGVSLVPGSTAASAGLVPCGPGTRGSIGARGASEFPSRRFA